MFWLILFLIAAILAAIFVALHNPLFRRISTDNFLSYDSWKQYLMSWSVYLVLGLIGGFLLQLFLKFGPLVSGLPVIPAFLGALIAMGIFAFFLYAGNLL